MNKMYYVLGDFSGLKLKHIKIHFKLRQEKYFVINKPMYLLYLCIHKHVHIYLFIAYETILFIHMYFYKHTLFIHVGLAM